MKLFKKQQFAIRRKMPVSGIPRWCRYPFIANFDFSTLYLFEKKFIFLLKRNFLLGLKLQVHGYSKPCHSLGHLHGEQWRHQRCTVDLWESSALPLPHPYLFIQNFAPSSNLYFFRFFFLLAKACTRIFFLSISSEVRCCALCLNRFSAVSEVCWLSAHPDRETVGICLK